MRPRFIIIWHPGNRKKTRKWIFGMNGVRYAKHHFTMSGSLWLYFKQKLTNSICLPDRSGDFLGQHRTIRLRHLPDKMCPDLVTFSCNTQSIPAKKCRYQNPFSLGICSCRIMRCCLKYSVPPLKGEGDRLRWRGLTNVWQAKSKSCCRGCFYNKFTCTKCAPP